MTTNEQIMAVLATQFDNLERGMAEFRTEVRADFERVDAHFEKVNGHIAENARINRDTRILVAGLEERVQDVERDVDDHDKRLEPVEETRLKSLGGLAVVGVGAQAFWAVVLVWLTLFFNQRCSAPISVPDTTATPTPPATATPAREDTATPTATVTPTLPTATPTPDLDPLETATPTQVLTLEPCLDDPNCRCVPECVTEVVVQPGDTLYAIGRRCGVEWTRIAAYELNQLTPPYVLTVGQVLTVPGVESCEGG